jgi:hypothetical protein
MRYPMVEKILAAEEDLRVDVMEEVENPGSYGWEITDEKGELVDQKYGFRSWEAAERAGEMALKQLKKI